MTIGLESIATLRNKLGEIDNLKEQLVNVVNEEIKRRVSAASTTATPHDTPAPVLRETKTAYLPRPKNGGILHTEDEVNEYVEALRRSLMKYINNNEDVLIK